MVNRAKTTTRYIFELPVVLVSKVPPTVEDRVMYIPSFDDVAMDEAGSLTNEGGGVWRSIKSMRKKKKVRTDQFDIEYTVHAEGDTLIAVFTSTATKHS